MRLATGVAMAIALYGALLLVLLLFTKTRGWDSQWPFVVALGLSVVSVIGGINRAFHDRPEGDAALVFSHILLVPVVIAADLALTWVVGCRTLGGCC